MNGIEMQNKFPIPLKSALLCLCSGLLVGLLNLTTNDVVFSVFLLPGFLMGVAFALAHKNVADFPKNWKIYLAFSFSYFIGLFLVPMKIYYLYFDKAGNALPEMYDFVGWNAKGFVGTLALILLLRLCGIRLRWFYILVLLLMGTTLTYFFYAKFLGEYGTLAGFAIWQTIMGGLLSFSTLNSKMK